MDLTCSQVEMLLSFYFDGELKENLRTKVEEHLNICPVCKQKYETLVSLLADLRESVAEACKTPQKVRSIANGGLEEGSDFRENLSAYVDNELNDEDNIKIKKLTINNKKARKFLEDSYALKHVLNNAYTKTKNDMRADYTKNILKALDIDGMEYTLNPFVKIIAILSAVALFGTIFVAIVLNVTW